MIPSPRLLLLNLLAFLFAASASAATSGNLAAPALPSLKVAIIGDSTVCNYPANVTTRGWGMYLHDYFSPNVTIVNLAKSGRSTKTFISEGLWAATLKEKPAIILIQFGHNDSHTPDHPEATNAATDFRANLRRYIDEARAIGATPVLITPMCRRTFGPAGNLTDNLQPYADAMKVVAAEKHVPLIDLHASSAKLYLRLGHDKCLKLANKTGDDTHFNEAGAKAMVGLVMQDLPAAAPALQPYLQSPAPAAPLPLATSPSPSPAAAPAAAH